MRRLFATIVIALAALVSASPVSADTAVPPPTLTGETLTISAPTIVTASCNPAGTSTISYAVSGVAVGSYPGAYSERGTVTLGPQTLPQFTAGFEAGPITSVEVSFSISSPTGHVTGTKSLPGITTDAFGFCYSPTVGGGTFAEVCACALSLTYQATINTPTGAQYGDTGRAGLILDEISGTVITPLGGQFAPENIFMESFASSLPTPFLICDPNAQANQNQTGNNQGCENP